MWQVFYLIKEAFYRDAADYFAGKTQQMLVIFHLFSFVSRNYELFTQLHCQ